MPNVEELIMRGRRQLLADEPPVAFTDELHHVTKLEDFPSSYTMASEQ